jgi:hypothetical protein
MTPPSQPPIFLERRSYRQRRMMDALRLLPVLGVLLWLFPLFWPSSPGVPGASEPMAMSGAVIYVFVVWLMLVAAAFILGRFLRGTLARQAAQQQAAEQWDAGGGEVR